MRYSIIFTEYDPEGVNREMTRKSLESILECSWGEDFELIHVRDVKGYVNAVNRGLKLSKGDYIFQVANDVLMADKDWLKKMTRDDCLVGWRLTHFFITGELRPDFACWGMSRKVYEELGPLSHEYENGYGFDDDDYTFTARKAGFEMFDAGVNLEHLECKTYNTIFRDDKEKMTKRNELIFRKKWNLPA